jgi:argininosuccinate lyase
MLKQRSSEYRGFRRAGIRLSEEVLPDVEEHRSDRVLATLYSVHAFDKAHLVMLAEEGLIPRQDAAAMLRVLREAEREGIERVRLQVGGGNHSGEQLLIRRLGEAVGGRIHLGRSSGDLGAIAKRIPQRDKLLDVMGELNRLRDVVLTLAAQHVDTVMPGYTFGQHAQPITLGHQLLAWGAVLGRDFERALEVYRRTNVSPAGAAIMTGSNFPLNRHRTSELLGFDRPAPNAFDAILSNDVTLDAFWALSILNNDLGRWADDLILWSTSEFGMIDIPDRFCGTSSIMMQKKNPYGPQYVKGAAGLSVGALVVAFHVDKGPTGVPALERQYAAELLWRLFADTVRDLKWWRELLPAIRWNTEVMRRRAGQYWAQATDIAGALVRDKGLPWRTAHQIVGIVVRHGYERGFGPEGVTPEIIDEAAVEYMGEPLRLRAESLCRALDPEEFVRSRTLYGGPAPEEALRRLHDFREDLRRDEAAYQAARRHVDEARAKLESAVDALVGETG